MIRTLLLLGLFVNILDHFTGGQGLELAGTLLSLAASLVQRSFASFADVAMDLANYSGAAPGADIVPMVRDIVTIIAENARGY
jgi:hypothetical protein